jgi:hypothetical protein
VTTLGTTTTVLRNEVRLVHASTGKTLGPVSARLTAIRYGWSVRTVDDTVVVSQRADLADPPVLPKLAVTLLDGQLADLLQFPAAPGLPPRTVLVALGPATVDVVLHPTPMVLEVVLTTATTDAPRAGRTVTARATSGPNPKPVIALSEASAGLYRSAAVEWTQRFIPADLLVDGKQLRTLSLDVSRTTTRVHLVDTT